MMKRRDLLRTLGAVGAVTAVERLRDPAAAGGQSFPAVSGRSTTDNLASRLAASIEKHKVPGASAAVFRAGHWEVAAAGVTNVTTGVDVTAETVMHIGSITKVLNATLVMQLVDEGRVELTAPLKRYLPDFQVADRKATKLITVEMLLNHTCGIDGEYFPTPDLTESGSRTSSLASRDRARSTRPAPSCRTATLVQCWQVIWLSGSSERAGIRSSMSESSSHSSCTTQLSSRPTRCSIAPRLDIFSTRTVLTRELRLRF
jgi:CubicO group peptidase (beta-lactamase class C family)